MLVGWEFWWESMCSMCSMCRLRHWKKTWLQRLQVGSCEFSSSATMGCWPRPGFRRFSAPDMYTPWVSYGSYGRLIPILVTYLTNLLICVKIPQNVVSLFSHKVFVQPAELGLSSSLEGATTQKFRGNDLKWKKVIDISITEAMSRALLEFEEFEEFGC